MSVGASVDGIRVAAPCNVSGGSGLPARVERRSGTVTSFDRVRGIGEITTADGATHHFHSTQLTDGTRSTAVGTEVEFEVVPGLPGRWEAARITPRS